MINRLKKYLLHNSIYLVLSLTFATAIAVSIKFEDEQRYANALFFDDCDQIRQVWIKAKCYRNIKDYKERNCKNIFPNDSESAMKCIEQIKYQEVEGEKLSHIYFISFTSFLFTFFFYFLKMGKDFGLRYFEFRESKIENYFDFLADVAAYKSPLKAKQFLKRYLIFTVVFAIFSFIIYLSMFQI